MRMKYIIVAVLASIGLIGGIWNWVNYFKTQNAGSEPQVQAVRPPPRPEIAALEQQNNAANAAPATPVDTAIKRVQQPKLNLDLPDTVGRDPFLTPGEIELIASGDFVEDVPPPIDTLGLKVTALMQDNNNGDYVALIGGRSYREGDMIGAEKVVEITDSFVVLEQAGHRRTLNLRNRENDSGVFIQLRNK